MALTMVGFVQTFQAIDADLRVIVSLTATSWEIEYLRDSLEGEYTEADFERTYRDHLATQVAADDLSQVIKGGDFIGQQYVFEDVIVFQFPTSRYEGFYVSYDWTDPFPMSDVLHAAEEVSFID
jgi:hypothetical protein